MKKKTYQLGVRMDEDLLARLRAFEKQTGVSSSALVRATLESALDYFEAEKEIVFPLCCVPRSKINFSPPPPELTFDFYSKLSQFCSREISVGFLFTVESVPMFCHGNAGGKPFFFYAARFMAAATRATSSSVILLPEGRQSPRLKRFSETQFP